jgi:hypothetical protein
MAGSRNIEILTTVPFPESVIQRLRGITPRIRLSFHPAKKAEDIPQEVWNKAEVLYTDILLPDIALVPNLKWVQFHYAGIDFVQESSLLTNPHFPLALALMLAIVYGVLWPMRGAWLMNRMLWIPAP